MTETENEIRRKIVEIARSQEDNDDPTKYWLDVGCDAAAMIKARRHWCGAAYLWNLHQAGLLVGVDWLIGKGLSHRRFGLKLTSSPLPGDLAYFSRNQHYATVTDVSAGMVGLVHGNSRNDSNPTGPTKVVIDERPRSTVHSFHSIGGLIASQSR